MGHQPERTCIGCRAVFRKGEVVRIVAGPDGAVIDYREKLPGRAAYVCPKRECINRALVRQNLSRALHRTVAAPDPGSFIDQLAATIRDKVRSLLSIAAKAGKLAAGASAVTDALQKSRVEMIVFARDLSDGTKEKLTAGGLQFPERQATLFTRDEIGRMVGRELVGVLAILDPGLSDAVWNETERLKGLLKGQS